MSVVQLAAIVFGAVYLLVGVIGFAITGLSGEGDLLIFAVNPLHNVVHLVIGAAALASFRSPGAAATTLTLLGAALGLVTVLGLFGVLGVLGMHRGIAEPDNFLHLASAVAALLIGLLFGPADEPETAG
jgi:hypothetical protein